MSTVLFALLLIAALLGKVVLNTRPGEPTKVAGWAQSVLTLAVALLLLAVIMRTINGAP
ncbi:MAG: hypothetical protein KIT69_21305 [Propionibacteriaceae bacterium]|nr:hypothetical protein [Propionibacteriaceae bacterium]